MFPSLQTFRTLKLTGSNFTSRIISIYQAKRNYWKQNKLIITTNKNPPIFFWKSRKSKTKLDFITKLSYVKQCQQCLSNIITQNNQLNQSTESVTSQIQDYGACYTIINYHDIWIIDDIRNVYLDWWRMLQTLDTNRHPRLSAQSVLKHCLRCTFT